MRFFLRPGKRLYRSSDILYPKQVMNVIQTSAKSTECVPSAHVIWENWKGVLGNYFKNPTQFHIMNYQCFIVKNSEHGYVFARKLSYSVHEKSFKFMLKRCMTGAINADLSKEDTHLQ